MQHPLDIPVLFAVNRERQLSCSTTIRRSIAAPALPRVAGSASRLAGAGGGSVVAVVTVAAGSGVATVVASVAVAELAPIVATSPSELNRRV